jgi:hypothetical protein
MSGKGQRAQENDGMITVLLAALLAGPLGQSPASSASTQPRLFQGLGGKPIVPVFAATRDTTPRRPQSTVKLAPRSAPALGGRTGDEREIVCGTVVIKKSPELDEKILLPSRETGAAVRRIEPDTCHGKTIVPAR